MFDLVLIIASSLVGAFDRPQAATQTAEYTFVTGVVREAVSRTPLAGAVVQFSTGDSTMTDSAGRFVVRVARGADWLGVRSAGHLDFQFPLLQLGNDSARFDIELRTNPPSAASYATGGILPYLCVVVEADRLDVTNSCRELPRPDGEYRKRIIKHNPWNPYFGAAGDRGGVLLVTRIGAE